MNNHNSVRRCGGIVCDSDDIAGPAGCADNDASCFASWENLNLNKLHLRTEMQHDAELGMVKILSLARAMARSARLVFSLLC